MSDRSNFRANTEAPERDNVVGDGRRPPRLQLTTEERRRLPVDLLVALTPLLSRDPATWDPTEEATVSAALERANGDETVAAVRVRFDELSPSARARRDTWRELVSEYHEVNRDLVAMRVRPTSDTYSRRRAKMWVDGLRREAGVAAREAEREAWRANPGDPTATMAIQAARERAEAEVEMRRPALEAEAFREFEADRRQDSDARFNERANRKRDLGRALQLEYVVQHGSDNQKVNAAKVIFAVTRELEQEDLDERNLDEEILGLFDAICAEAEVEESLPPLARVRQLVSGFSGPEMDEHVRDLVRMGALEPYDEQAEEAS